MNSRICVYTGKDRWVKPGGLNDGNKLSLFFSRVVVYSILSMGDVLCWLLKVSKFESAIAKN